VLPFAASVIVATVVVVTELVLIAKVPLDAPAAIVTDAGTVTAALLLVSVTTSPFEPALPSRCAVPVVLVPPVSVVEAAVGAARTAGVIVSVADLLVPLEVAVIVAVVVLFTPKVEIVNVLYVFPLPIVTVGGTAAKELLLDDVKVTPDGPALPFRLATP
jgi:hypothetical protein